MSVQPMPDSTKTVFYGIMGMSGYLLSFFNLDNAMSLGSTACIQTIGTAIWPLAAGWFVPALALLFSPFEYQFRWLRMGLVVGVATWLAPVVISTAYALLYR